MPTIPFRLAELSQRIDGNLTLAETLLFPEVSRLDADGSRSRRRVGKRVAKMLAQADLEELYRRRVAGDPQVDRVRITVPAPSHDLQWREPVKLQFEYVYWSHGEEAVVAYVPELGIEILADKPRSIKARVANEVRSALARLQATSSLQSLRRFGRRSELAVHENTITIDIATPKQVAERELRTERDASVLREVATKFTKATHAPVHEREEEVAQLAGLLAEPQPQSVLLVGPSGVGKTAIFREVARRRRKLGLAARTFWSTSGARLVAGMSGFGMWQLRCQELIQEATKTKSIVHLGNLVELLEVGKAIGQKQGIASFLRPAIARGELLSTAECTAEQLSVIEREDPQLLASFAKLTVPELSAEQTRSILLAAAVAPPALVTLNKRDKKRPRSQRSKLTSANAIEPEAIETLDRLHRRYATYSTAPGRPLRFLRNLLEDRVSDHTLDSVAVTEAFSRETGLPRFMIDDSVPMDSDAAQQWFAARVMGQAEPVELIVDLLATMKAGLTRTDRPIASLLFVGPTGVGKTEMAKALAEFLYQDAERMVRIDMSEYADPAAVERLIAGTRSAEGVLTHKVREQPFSVVLLDEFEKAHPRLFDLLLQVLGEGRLTDASGRLADFRNSVVILTSNLGAEGFRDAKLGFAGSSSARDASQYFTRQAREFLRPEMFNRLDRIVPFLPLDAVTISSIIRRELDKVRGRDGIRYRDLSLRIDDAVVGNIAARGYHPRYGARPLKRQLEQQLVARLAQRLNDYTALTPLEAEVQLDGDRIDMKVRAVDRPHAANDLTQQTLAGIEQLSTLRRQAQRLEQSPTVLRLRNEAYRLQQQLKHAERNQGQLKKRRPRSDSRNAQAEQQLRVIEGLLARIETLLSDVVSCEDETLVAFYQERQASSDELRMAIAESHESLHQVLLDLQLFGADRRSQVSLCIFGDHNKHVAALARAYEALATRRRWTLNRYHLKVYRPALDDSLPAVQRSKRREPAGRELRPSLTLLARQQSEDEKPKKTVDAFAADGPANWLNLPPDVIGVALQLQGEAAFALLEPEVGVHEFTSSVGTQRCLVETSAGLLVNYNPPPGIGRRGSFREQPLRRKYNLDKRIAFDKRLETELEWVGANIDEVVIRAVEQFLKDQAWRIVEA